MAIMGDYVNGNHRTILYDDGTRFRETGSYVEGKWVADDAGHFIFSPGMSNGSKHSLRWRTGKDFSLKLKNRD